MIKMATTKKKNKKIQKSSPKDIIKDQGKALNNLYKTKVRVIGIGGGAGNIISEIALKLPKINFVAVNTDTQDLKKVAGKKILCFQFGQDLTKGQGTGMDVDLARDAALREKEKIKKLFSGYDFCIFIACLGGGTGSGAAPVFAKIAKSFGLVTLGIFTLPFKFEGERKLEIAKTALRDLRPNVNALIILPNEKIFQVIDKNSSFKETFSIINKNLAENLIGLIETIYQPGLINIDFADLKTVLEGQGKLAFLNTILIEKEKDKTEAIKQIINNPFYFYGIKGAKSVLLNIVGEKNLSLFDISQFSKTISELANPEAKIVFGIGQNKKLRNQIKITFLATGYFNKIFSETEKRKKIIKKKSVKKASLTKIETIKEKGERKRKIKIKIKKKLDKKPEKEENISQSKNKEDERIEGEIRKNGLQLKKEAEEAEKEILAKEEIWETPTFLRNKK